MKYHCNLQHRLKGFKIQSLSPTISCIFRYLFLSVFVYLHLGIRQESQISLSLNPHLSFAISILVNVCLSVYRNETREPSPCTTLEILPWENNSGQCVSFSMLKYCTSTSHKLFVFNSRSSCLHGFKMSMSS